MIGHADRLSPWVVGLEWVEGRAKSAWSIMEGDWQLVKWVGLCVVRMCVCARWIEVGYRGTTSLTVTEDEWREFPPEQILHPPLAAALS